MNHLKKKTQKVFRQLKSQISEYITNDSDDLIPITVEVDTDLYTFIQHKAKREQTSEQAIILQAIKHHVESRSFGFHSIVSPQKKEDNPLFLLDGFTKTLK